MPCSPSGPVFPTQMRCLHSRISQKSHSAAAPFHLSTPVQRDTTRLDIETSHPFLIFWMTVSIQITGSDKDSGHQRPRVHLGINNTVRKFCPCNVTSGHYLYNR